MFTQRAKQKQSKFYFDRENIQGITVKLEPKDEESIQGGTLFVILDSFGSMPLRSPYEGCDPGTCCDPLN